MDIVHDFECEVEVILETCENIISNYPNNLRAYAKTCLEKFHLLRGEGRRKGGFCYLMPFWLKQPFELDYEFCHSIALANTFGLLYFLTIDDVVDNNERISYQIPLSTLFYSDFVLGYQKVFSHDSLFWEYFQEYLNEWAGSILWEKTEHKNTVKPYCEEDFILLSRKAAPLKIPFAAICIKAGRDDLIQSFSNLVDYDQVTYQMIDDCRDWREDLKNGNYTYLLVKAIEHSCMENLGNIEITNIRKYIHSNNVLNEVINVAMRYNAMAKESLSCTSVYIPYLEAYLDCELKLCSKTEKLVSGNNKRAEYTGLGGLLEKLKI